MGRRFELDRELNHIAAAWMSWLCAEAQTVGYQIRTQGLFFHSPFFISHHLFLFSQPFLTSYCLALLLSLAPTLLPPSVFSYSLSGDGVTRVSRLRNQCGGLFRQPGKCSVSFFFLLHLSNSPLHLSIRVWDCRSPPHWAGWRFFMPMTRIVCSPKIISLVVAPCEFPISHHTNSNFSG